MAARVRGRVRLTARARGRVRVSGRGRVRIRRAASMLAAREI